VGPNCGAVTQHVEELQENYSKAKTKSAKDVTLAIEAFNVLYVAATRPIQRLRGAEKYLDARVDQRIDINEQLMASIRNHLPEDDRSNIAQFGNRRAERAAAEDEPSIA
jgi:hypothetical protein